MDDDQGRRSKRPITRCGAEATPPTAKTGSSVAITGGEAARPPSEGEAASLDPDYCYRALRSRDPRFDGRFFVGVASTGVYCRPVCPARTPKRANVEFFTCAAAAEKAGFRPCLRCRPESAPGTPAWAGSSATVVRALRLIEEGALDGSDVGRLAGRLGIGDRHLRRLFGRHLGVAPNTLALNRRLHFARRLLCESDLKMNELALASGFSSLRRFNEAMRKAYGNSPGELRARCRNGKLAPAGGIRLRLHYRPPYDWTAMLAFLQTRAVDGIEAVRNGVYRRSFPTEAGYGILTVSNVSAANALQVDIEAFEPSSLRTLSARITRLFDLGADPALITKVLAADPLLEPLLRARPGLRVPGAWDPFEVAVRAVVGQQISVAAAGTVIGRIAQRYGEKIEAESAPAINRLFPRPERLAEAEFDGIGLTRSRWTCLRELSATFANQSAGGYGGPTIADLKGIKGVGPWTASYVAMRAVSDPDAFPEADLVLQRMASRGNERIPAGQLLKRSQAWRPWRAYAAIHLWTAAADQEGRATANAR